MLAKITMFLLFLLLGVQSVTTNTLKLHDSSSCAEVDIYASDESAKQPIIFTAEVEEPNQVNATTNSSMDKLDYEWTISAGRIISGDKTNKIKVDRRGLRGQTMTLTVAVSGFSGGCVATQSFAHQVRY